MNLEDEEKKRLILWQWVEDPSEKDVKKMRISYDSRPQGASDCWAEIPKSDMKDEGVTLYAVVPRSKTEEIKAKMELQCDMLWQEDPHIDLCTTKALAWRREVYVNKTCAMEHENYVAFRITITQVGVLNLLTTINDVNGNFKPLLERRWLPWVPPYSEDKGFWRFNLKKLCFQMKNGESEELIKTTMNFEELDKDDVKGVCCCKRNGGNRCRYQRDAKAAIVDDGEDVDSSNRLEDFQCDLSDESLILYAIMSQGDKEKTKQKGVLETDAAWRNYVGLRNSKKKAWDRASLMSGVCHLNLSQYAVLKINITKKGVLTFATASNGWENNYCSVLKRMSYTDNECDWGVWRVNSSKLPLEMKNSNQEVLITLSLIHI